MENENLGAAERVVQSLISYKDHMVHNRTGAVFADPSAGPGARWEQAVTMARCSAHPDARSRKDADGKKVCAQCGGPADARAAFRCLRGGKPGPRLGAVLADGSVVDGGRTVARLMPAGIFPEIAAWMYRQVAEVWRLDNEFAARWASWAFAQEERDLKVVLAAFMLCQSRKGDPVFEDGGIAFRDEDYRDVGEAMFLSHRKGADMSAKMLLRAHDLLRLPAVAEINRELGFTTSRQPYLGRWRKAVEKWLRYREENPKVLAGLLKSGQRTQVVDLCCRARYRPSSPKFLEALRWKQGQAKDGRRTIAIGAAVPDAESWEGLSERQVCEKIVRERPGFKRVTGLLPRSVGLTRAVMAAAVEAGSLSDKDLVIMTPTLEELGLLQDPDVRKRWESALRAAEDTRAANVARNARGREAKEALQGAADAAVRKAVEEVDRGIRVYFMVDISGSMTDVIDVAKRYCAKLVQAFPLDRLHVACFNSSGYPVEVRHPTKAGVENAFRGKAAGGGTDYGAGVRAVQGNRPEPGEDALFFFVGDEDAGPFAPAVRASGIDPVAFALVKVTASPYGASHSAVRSTAAELGIPCVVIDEAVFEDPYAVPRTLRRLIQSAPVGRTGAVAPQRTTLAEQILKTDLLQKPAWAA